MLVRSAMIGVPACSFRSNLAIVSSGQLRKRSSMTIASAESRIAGSDSEDGVLGIDGAVLVHREQDAGLEAVALAEDLGQHRQRFLAAVLLVAGEEDDVPALSGPGFLRIGEADRCRLLRSPDSDATNSATTIAILIVFELLRLPSG